MINWLNTNANWFFDGFGTWIIGCVFFAGFLFLFKWLYKNFKIIKREKYNNLLNYESTLNKLLDKTAIFEGLEYDFYNGIYFKINSEGIKEIFCPRCKDSDSKLIHLNKCKQTTDDLYICKECKTNFGEGLYSYKANNLDKCK